MASSLRAYPSNSSAALEKKGDLEKVIELIDSGRTWAAVSLVLPTAGSLALRKHSLRNLKKNARNQSSLSAGFSVLNLEKEHIIALTNGPRLARGVRGHVESGQWERQPRRRLVSIG